MTQGSGNTDIGAFQVVFEDNSATAVIDLNKRMLADGIIPTCLYYQQDPFILGTEAHKYIRDSFQFEPETEIENKARMAHNKKRQMEK